MGAVQTAWDEFDARLVKAGVDLSTRCAMQKVFYTGFFGGVLAMQKMLYRTEGAITIDNEFIRGLVHECALAMVGNDGGGHA